MSPPDGLLTLGLKHDVELAEPHIIIAPDPFASDDCFDDFSPEDLYLLTAIEEPHTMLTGEDEPSSGLNGRLRPRKSNIPSPQTIKTTRKTDPKPAQEKPKRTSTPSKASPNKPDDLTNKSDSPALHILCPYCDKTFFTKQAISKHVRRIHILAPNDYNINCLYCNHTEADANDIIRHMVDNHPNQYFACYDCHTRFPSTTELADHKLNDCEKQKLPYRNKLRPKTTPKKSLNTLNISTGSKYDEVESTGRHEFNGLVISCELKLSHAHDPADIEDNITTNFILPPPKNIGNSTGIEKNAVIILDDLQWNKRMPTNFSFHNTDADQILSRLGVVHRSPRAGEFNKRDWSKNIDESNQKFEKCFDTSFYSKVASNVQENLSKFLDGSFNFNPDPENTIKTRRAKNSVAINTVEGFPILLECEQFSRTHFDRYLPRALAPKHKLKWDTLENDRNLLNPEQIKRDSHTNNCIISLVSSLDIWTQLCMREKFEEKFNKSPLEKKTEKQNIIGKELKEILESRELPTSSSQIVKYTNSSFPVRDNIDFPASLGLIPSAASHNSKPAILSGEWVRPRCYVCCACGAQTRDSRALSSHISARHPNAQIQHYEIVGDVLLKSDILKHLYVPPNQLNNRTRPLRGIRECTKCKKSISLEDLHQHMLDCAGDTPAVRRKCRYRPFGVRKRRPRLPDNTIRREMRKDISTQQHNRKNHMRPRPKIRTEVGDAETIRKMLADLPAKRHRITVNPLNTILRPRRKLNSQRNKLLMKKRPTEDMKKKQLLNTEPRDNETENFESRSTEPENSQSNTNTKPFVKRVDSKILCNNETLNRKPTMIKNKRKNIPHKEPQDHCDTSDIPDMTSRPPDASGGIQLEQLSTQNNSGRIFINNGGGGSYREHGNGSNNGSSNRDNNNSGYSGENNNSGDSFEPSQNIPLKHSIASLTASSETHDKSVQFHHLFLVQQECNNVTNHVPSGQRMLFENEAVVRKLDKPPLHFNHQGYMDPLLFQKNKLNKPRKGLNDCIAMLKNKLEDPSPSTFPLHVSVQCGSDEPLGPEPIIIERRHSTTESNNESTQRSLQMLYPEVPAQNNFEYQNIPKRPTRRRSTTTRQRQNSGRDKSFELLANNDYINWNQYYYESQMLSAKNNKRQPARRKSMTPADDFLLQHALNIELLNKSSRELQNLSEYHYANLTMPYKQTKKKARETTPKSNSRGRSDVEVPKSKNKETPKTREKNSTRTRRTRVNSQPINQFNLPDTNCIPMINRNDQYIHHVPAICTYAPGPEKSMDCCTLAAIQEENINICLERELTHSKLIGEQTLHHINQQNPPVVEYTADNSVHQSLYTIPYESTATAPLDLSNNIPNNDNSLPYLPQMEFCSVNYEPYETLDLSNKHLNNETVKETDVTSEDVVDLSLRFSSHPPHDTRPSPIPSDLGNNDMEEGPTDLSIVRVDDYIPTDLSVRRRIYPFQSYERTVEDISQINYIQDLSHPIRNVENVCILVPLREGEEENEQPTDLSRSNLTSRPDVTSLCLTEQQDIYLNVFRNNPVPVDDNIPADLSGRTNDVQSVQYLESQAMNVNDGLLLHESMNRQLSHGLDNEQIINLHYNSGYRTPVQTSYDEESERFDDRSHNIPVASIVSPSSIIHDYSNNNSSLNDHSISHSNKVLSYTDRYSDEPLSLTTNSVQLESNSKALSVSNITHCSPGLEVANYEDNTPIYSLPNDRNSTPSPVLVVKTPPSEKTFNSPVCNNTECLELNISEYPIANVEPSNDENSDTNKLLSTHNTQNCKEDNSTFITSQVNLEQDQETARKIAMLPKELVEILGTMPVDHRNQLLNVLPQYVSTSATEPNLIENSRPKSDDISCTPPMKRNIKKDDILKHVNASDKVSDSNVLNTSPTQMLICPEAPHISVSSSVLLTPPTPQLSDRHSIQSQDNDEVKSDSVLIRLSTEDRTHFDVLKSDDQQINEINMSIVKRLTHLESDLTEDRIIDLTGDDYLNPNEYENNSECTKRLNDTLRDHSSSNLSCKSSSHKVNNDKTASLRAVRIKTPSERHRSILTDQQSVKNTAEKTMKQVNEQDTNKNPELLKPLAIQQAEISSTQHNKLNNANNKQVNKCSELHLNNALNQQPQNQSKSTEIKHDEVNVNPNITAEKINCVTSSIPKDVNSKTEKDAIPIPDKNASEKSNIALIISPADRKVNVSDSNTLTENIFTDPLSKAKSLSINDKKDVHYKEVSEDDPILTNMTNQKNCDSNILVTTEQKLFEKESNVTDNGNKIQSSDKESKIMSTKLPYVTDNLKENKRTIDSKDCSLHNREESVISKASNDISMINQDSEKQSKVNERITLSNQKGKRGRRPEQISKTKNVEAKDQVSNQSEIYKKDINKENNYYSDSTNKDKSSEDLVKSKVMEKDNEIISAISAKVSNIKETIYDKPIRNENSQELLEKHSDSRTFKINASVTINESDNCLDKPTVKQSEKSLFSHLTHNCPKTETVVSEKAPLITKKSETLDNIYSNLHSISDRIKDDSDINAGNILSNKSLLNSKDIQVVDISSDVEEVHTTPVRRSRRVKSIYMNKNNIETETTLHQYTNEPRAPLTKKQLIFSKLLLDEENHNNNKNSNEDLEIDYKSTKSPRNNDLDIQESRSNTTKANKRKTSPQSKGKSKKQKSLPSLKTTIDIISDKSQTDSKNKSLETIVTNNIESNIIEGEQYINGTGGNIGSSKLNCISTAEANSEHTRQRTPIEKRKSTSPPRPDLVLSSKPKKCKLYIAEENTMGSSEGSEEKQLTETNMAENKTISPTLRNTTCYNKTIRRLRENSIVENIPGLKLYDPYDIDLEDMVEETEPFIRKEIPSKNSNVKSSAIDKPRKLTAPSADIETHHPDHYKATSSASILGDNCLSKSNNKIISNSETATKDSDTDASSKSDEPLKKNTVEKEKCKPAPASNRNNVDNPGTESNSGREKSKTRGRKKRILSTNTKDEKNILSNDNEEELRSEQFMESFGFFSERKPRKSNLLATKKISETFHIIANESDDAYFSSLDRLNRKSVPVNKQADEVETMNSAGVVTKKPPAKRGRKKKSPPPPEPAFCGVCKKAFRRLDNYTRHQISLYHISKMSGGLNPNTIIFTEEEHPNYLIVFQQQLDRIKIMQDKVDLRQKNGFSTSLLVVPTLKEILEDVKKIIREQILARRELSRDEALFVDCCEMLKESHKNAVVNRRNCNSFNCFQVCFEELAALEKSIEEKYDKYDGVVDSITAKNIMESEEVRNLENDLISGLKEANGLKGADINYHTLGSLEVSGNNATNMMHISNYIQVEDFGVIEEPVTIKTKRNSEVKDKMYPDVVENIDMFEDKFDKIKRKCRSQAAAAKQIKTLADANSSHKNRKKSEKKKAKQVTQQNHNTVPTKGALKGFDGIKVSISTSDINMDAIVPSVGNSLKRKKKSGSKKKRERKNSDDSSNYDSDHHPEDQESSEKKVDVYEFMDTEDTELFEFRPSTLMERFRIINNKEIPSTSKTHTLTAADVFSESGSDGDDFVYMSDNYVGSDDETENSLLSCEFGNVKGGSNEYKKSSSPLKRKDVIEKNAVMGKIFKHNAVRSERRRSKSREPVKTQANMDQLFDSLFEDKPKSSISPNQDSSLQRSSPLKQDKPMAKTEYNYKKRNEHLMTDLKDNSLFQKYDPIPSTSTQASTSVLGSSSKKRKSITPPRKLDLNALRALEYSLASPKNDEDTNSYDRTFDYYARSSQRQLFVSNKFTSSEDDDFTVPKHSHNKASHSKSEDVAHLKNKHKDKVTKDKSYSKKRTEEDRRQNYDSCSEVLNRALITEDTGVAVQRARRKCTVGKQNVLAETWSSESEPDGAPPRPSSVESVVPGAGRKKRGRKRDGGAVASRRGGAAMRPSVHRQARPRPPSYWSECEDEHPQQHGWIVGDSHKKLVTMLAHAKGRKRSGDDKRSAVLE